VKRNYVYPLMPRAEPAPRANPERSVAVAPRREVTLVVEVEGLRGGVQLVHVLTCGHWLTRWRVVKQVACIGCAIDAMFESPRPR